MKPPERAVRPPEDLVKAPEPGAELRGRPVHWTARLGRALREEGVPCSLTETLAATEALRHLDLADARDVHLGLRAVFLGDRRDEPAFDRVFWTLWGQRQGPVSEPEEGALDVARRLRKTAGRRPEPSPAAERERDAARRDAGARRGAEVDDPDGRRVGTAWSPRETLAKRSFASLREDEVRELDRAFDLLMVRLATRRSRRMEAGGRRGRVDFRRSLRDALRHDGELIRLARRRRRIERPRIVLLCDVSGSMERYSRFLVRFLLAARRERRVETFVFSTRLTRLTPHLSRSRVDEALSALGERVPGWSGGTRIGESLEAFLDGYGRSLLGQRTVVIILSDGLDQGETEPLERAMEGIARKARKVIWLNPLLESPRYRPEARGMKAALPYVDDFASGHSLEALRELTALIRL